MAIEGAVSYAATEPLTVNLTLEMAIGIVLLGFIGGTLFGFLGSGGAFVMTLGLMNLGIPGILAVGSNITHVFGKAIIGSRAHGELGHVDKKLVLTMLPGMFLGVKLAVYIQKQIFKLLGKAGSNLYISIVFIIVLSILVTVIIRDLRRKEPIKKLNIRLVDKLPKIPPVLHYNVSNLTTSFWYPFFIAFLTSFLAGTTGGAGGFIGVPAMIYILGLSTRMAAGNEITLAIASSALGATLYAIGGFVDLRIAMLLYLGSLIGIQLGAIATEILSQRRAKYTLMFVLLSAIISRAVIVPVYLNNLGYIQLTSEMIDLLKKVSFLILFGVCIVAVSMILKSIISFARKGVLHREVTEA